MRNPDQVEEVVDDGRRRPRIRTVNVLESKTVQSQRDLSDINEVLKKYQHMGIVDHMENVDLQFRDVSEFEDFSDVMRQSADARTAFLRLPPQLRTVFRNDVSEWLDCAHDPEKLEALRPKLEKLGVLEPSPAPVAPAAPSVAPAAPVPASE